MGEYMDMRKKTHEEIAQFIDNESNTYDMTSEMEIAEHNLQFEKSILENPIPQGTGKVDVFGCEPWDINMILKGNYWGRSIYTTDKICKLFLKWNLERQKKYLRKKNIMDFDWTWLLIIMIIGVVAVMAVLFLLPQIGGAI